MLATSLFDVGDIRNPPEKVLCDRRDDDDDDDDVDGEANSLIIDLAHSVHLDLVGAEAVIRILFEVLSTSC